MGHQGPIFARRQRWIEAVGAQLDHEEEGLVLDPERHRAVVVVVVAASARDIPEGGAARFHAHPVAGVAGHGVGQGEVLGQARHRLQAGDVHRLETRLAATAPQGPGAGDGDAAGPPHRQVPET